MRNRRKPGQSDQFVRKFWIIYLSSLGFIVLFFFAVTMGWLGFMPSFEELENPKSNQASLVISADQQILGSYFIENRSNVHYRELSPNLVNALIATEDIRFMKHSGVDGRAFFRVVFGMVTGTSKGGGSTITQQLAKNLFPRKKNSIFLETALTKFKEWITAIKLERNYTKEEIIAMYFNTVDFGSQSFGIKTAAMTYFGKSPADLKIEEAAMLVGLLKAPTWFSPVRNPSRAIKRREVVLHQMMKYKYISEREYDSIKTIPIDISHYQAPDHTSGLATYFREYLRNYLTDWCSKHYKADGKPYNLYKDGLKIYTTLNSKMQKYAEEAVHEHLARDLQPEFFRHWKGYKNAPFDPRLPASDVDNIMKQAMFRSGRYINMKEDGATDAEIRKVFNTPVKMKVFSWKGPVDTVMSPWDSIRYHKYFLLSGLMSVEPQTGYVRAYVGGIDYNYFQYDHVKVSKRQVGSTFKPIVYTLAMQEGELTPCSLVPNVKISVTLPTGEVWEPENTNHDREGEMVTLKWALANSINWISGYLINRYSPEAVVKTAHKMGITSDIPAVPSICLGTPDISLYEMVGAMNCFANKGVYIEPIFLTRIEDKNGNVIQNFIPKQQEAMSEQTAYLMLELMKGVVQSGTGVRIRYRYNLSNPIAGKTGTTQNNSDGWFMGLTPNLVTGVWVGCEDRSVHFRSTNLGQGASMALPIWAIYMKKIYGDNTLKVSMGDFEKPSTGIPPGTDCDINDTKGIKASEWDDSDKF